MNEIVLFGAGKIAEVVYHYLTNDSDYEVKYFCVEGEYIRETEKYGIPVVAWEDIEDIAPPDKHDMFVATGYQQLNNLRTRVVKSAKEKGYKLVKYICSKAGNFGDVEIGENSMVLENVAINPTAKIGSNVFIWSGNHIGHHATVKDNCYIAGQVVISGGTTIGESTFIGVNSTIGHEIKIGTRNIIGAGSIITKSTEPNSVYIAGETKKFRLDADSFLKLTRM